MRRAVDRDIKILYTILDFYNIGKGIGHELDILDYPSSCRVNLRLDY